MAWNAPQNSYEAMQLLIVYFFIHEYVCGTRVRTLGRLDVLLQPFYARDLKNGTFTKEEIVEMLKFFLYKFWLAKVPYDLPFAIGGMGVDGEDVTNEMSWMIVEAYDSLNIYSPKIHVKVCKKTPSDFVKRVLRCIRGGNSSFVFINDEVGIKALMDVGITEKEARNFVPIGCYEPAVWGVEMGCTGNGGVSLPKMVELVMTGGVDLRSGDQLGVPVGPVNSFRDFVAEIKKQLTYFTEYALEHITEIEKRYDQMHADPLLSVQYDHSVETGVDVHTGGAKYNNSSLYFYSIGSLIDSMEAVRELVFEKKRVSYEQLCEIVKNNWEGYENLRTYALMKCPKYGNHIAETDALTKEMTDFAAGLVNNKPNGRGGVFKAALFTIDFCFQIGKRTMATPDGRLAGEPLSKNLCATVGMDKKGITSLIHSVTQIDHSKFPNGSVLDILLHPTAVAGEEGLEAFYGILMTYFAKGGFGIHGNVFDVNTLLDAQKNPDKYRNLQVRLCGWNVYFVNLSKEEQDSFIAQAK